jgi:putative flippase GtrA
MDMGHLYSKKFGYKLEFLFQMVKLGARIKEIPLQFGLRQAGKSKISSQTATDIFRTVVLLRLNDPTTKKFIKFGIVGFLGFVINALALEYFNSSSITQKLSSYFLNSNFALLKTDSSWAGALAAELAIISNFILNNFWTFSSDKVTSPFKFIYKFLQFNLTSAGAVVIQFAVIGGATLGFGNTIIVRQLALIFSIAFLIIPYNWLMYTKIIWSHKK